MTPADWDRLYDATLTGNEAEFNTLFQKLSVFLLSVAQSHLRSKPEIAEEAYSCVQEAALAIGQAIQKRKGPQHRRAMCSWCTRIVIHKVLDLLRHYGYLGHPDHVAPESRFEELQEETAIVEEPGNALIHDLVQQELIVKIFTHPRLTTSEKYVLWMSFMEEEDDITIANVLGIKRITVRVIRMRALQKLRQDENLNDDW